MNQPAPRLPDADAPLREASLRALGNISYALHAIVAIGAVLPALNDLRATPV